MRCKRSDVAKWIVLGLLLLLSSFCFGATATGYAQTEDCQDLKGLSIYLERLDGRPLEKTIVLKVPKLYLAEVLAKEKQGTLAYGGYCVSAGHCEDAKIGEVQFVEVHRKHVSGKFKVTLQDGRKLEGDFTAKVRRAKHGLICE